MTCPLLYRFRTIDKLPEPLSPDAVRGTVVHKVLEDLFDLPAVARTAAQAQTMVEPAWAAVRESDPELAGLFPDDAEGEAFTAWMARLRAALDEYFRLEDPTRLEPAERELYVEAVLDSKLLLRGFVDRLDVAPNGAMRVVDYKSGRAPREGFENKAFFQLKLYALVLWRTRGTIPAMLQLLYLGSGDVLRYEPTERDLVATERKIDAVWAAIRAAEASGDWRPSPSRLCDWCAHQAICPAFGGTPPPLPARSATGGPLLPIHSVTDGPAAPPASS